MTMWHKLWRNKLTLLFILGFLVRIYGATTPAQPYDIGTYHAWGLLMSERGPVDFFATVWSDYLPLPIFFCTLIASISRLLSLPFALLFKLTTSFVEFGLLALIYRLVRSPKKHLLLPFLFLSPALIGNTSFWGQTDSLPSLLSVLTLIYLTRKRIFLAAILFALAVSLKPIMLVLTPIILIFGFRQKGWLLAGLLSLFVFLLPALPVTHSLPEAFNFLFIRALEQASTYPYTSINAFNLWTIRSTLVSWPPDVQSVLGLSAHHFGLLLYFALTLNTLRLWRRDRFSPRSLFRVAATLLITFFAVTTRMHERHLLFGLPFLALAALETPWLRLPLVVLTFSYTLNLYAAYSWVVNDQVWPITLPLVHFLSWINLLISFLLALSYDWRRLLIRLKLFFHHHRLLSIILALALVLRLFNLSSPPKYVFDEVYHAFTARELVADNRAAWEWWTTPPPGVAYEWTHPPVAKYGMVAGLLIFGDNSVGWRFFSAIFGVISIWGIYELTRRLKLSRATAILAAFLLTLSGLHLVQSRIGMNDIYMLAFLVWSLSFALVGKWKKAAIIFGLSLASKWSALYGLLPLLGIYLHQFRLSFRSLLSSLRYLLVSSLTYFLSYTPFFLAHHTWGQFLELHRQMWYYHTHLVATHAYQSVPWQWALSLRPVWYHVQYGDLVSNIYAQGNPLLLWLGLVAFIMTLPKLKQFHYLLLAICYLAFVLPWVFSPRIMFFYHYLPSVSFLATILADFLVHLSSRARMLLVIALITSFIIMSPVYFGFPMPSWYWNSLFALFPTWK